MLLTLENQRILDAICRTDFVSFTQKARWPRRHAWSAAEGLLMLLLGALRATRRIGFVLHFAVPDAPEEKLSERGSGWVASALKLNAGFSAILYIRRQSRLE